MKFRHSSGFLSGGGGAFIPLDFGLTPLGYAENSILYKSIIERL